MTTLAPLQSVSLAITEDVIQAYATLTNDFNPIHVDAAFAATTPMGRPIAHGTMSLCLIWQWLQRNFGAQSLADTDLQVRFVKPVYIGDVVTAGGQPSEQVPGLYDVWVRGQDGSDRIVGTCGLNASQQTQPGDAA